MKTKEDMILEMKVGDILLNLIYDMIENDLYNEVTTSDLQSICQVKAMDIIKLVREAQ
jgi:hypothetical protein